MGFSIKQETMEWWKRKRDLTNYEITEADMPCLQWDVRRPSLWRCFTATFAKSEGTEPTLTMKTWVSIQWLMLNQQPTQLGVINLPRVWVKLTCSINPIRVFTLSFTRRTWSVVTHQSSFSFAVWQWTLLWHPGQNIGCRHSTVSLENTVLFFIFTTVSPYSPKMSQCHIVINRLHPKLCGGLYKKIKQIFVYVYKSYKSYCQQNILQRCYLIII